MSDLFSYFPATCACFSCRAKVCFNWKKVNRDCQYGQEKKLKITNKKHYIRCKQNTFLPFLTMKIVLARKYREPIVPYLHVFHRDNVSGDLGHWLPIIQQIIFAFVVAAFYNDSGLNLYSLSLNMMKLNIPKCQCSFTLPTTVCIVGGVTSRSLSQVFWINNKTRLQLLKSAVTRNSKLVYYCYYKYILTTAAKKRV